MKRASNFGVTVRVLATTVTAVAISLAGFTAGMAQQGGCTYQGPGNPFTISAAQTTSFVTNMLCAAAAGESNIDISRTVEDTTGRGCWTYFITKTGSVATEHLPGVKAADCSTKPTVAQLMTDTTNTPPQIVMTASPPNAPVGLNEPIFADLTLLNPSPDQVSVDLGLNRTSNLELTILAPNGDIITQTLSSAGLGLSGDVSLPPGATSVERLLLNEWYDFPQPGTYQIKMTLLDDSADPAGVSVNRPSTGFSVQIGPRDPVRLMRLAQQLADTAIGGATLEDKMEAAKTLSYVLDPLAVSSLVRVLQQSPIVAQHAVDGLGRIRNPEAIDALTAARDYLDEEIRTAVRYKLDVLQGRTPTASKRVD